jgi:hypothetical protein
MCDFRGSDLEALILHQKFNIVNKPRADLQFIPGGQCSGGRFQQKIKKKKNKKKKHKKKKKKKKKKNKKTQKKKKKKKKKQIKINQSTIT